MHLTRSEGLSVGTQGNVASELFEHAALHVLEPGKQCRTDQAGCRANGGGMHQHAAHDREVEWSRLADQRRKARLFAAERRTTTGRVATQAAE